jgi:hypothetical protein
MNMWCTTAVVMCSFRRNSPTGYAPPIYSDDEDILPLKELAQPDWLPVQLPAPPPPQAPPPPHPLPEPEFQSITVDKNFANFCSVLNLQLIPEDERDTDAAAAARQEAATAAAAAASRIARADYLTVPEELSPEQLISLLHHYPEAAAAACAERMRRTHNLQIVGWQSHPFIGQFINAAEPPSCSHRSGPPSCGRCGSEQHVRLETTSLCCLPIHHCHQCQHRRRCQSRRLLSLPLRSGCCRCHYHRAQWLRTQTCLDVNYQILARHALLSRGRTVLRPVRRRCTRQIPLPTRVPAPAPALHLVHQRYIFRLLLYPG